MQLFSYFSNKNVAYAYIFWKNVVQLPAISDIHMLYRCYTYVIQMLGIS